MRKETSFSKQLSTSPLNCHVRLKKTSKEIENPDADEKPNVDQNQKENEHPDIDEIKNEPLQSIQD